MIKLGNKSLYQTFTINVKRLTNKGKSIIISINHHTLIPMKQVTFTAEEFDLVFNLLQDHLDDVLQDEFFHSIDHQKAQEAQGLTVDALRSMKAYLNDSLEAECFEGAAGLTA